MFNQFINNLLPSFDTDKYAKIIFFVKTTSFIIYIKGWLDSKTRSDWNYSLHEKIVQSSVPYVLNIVVKSLSADKFIEICQKKAKFNINLKEITHQDIKSIVKLSIIDRIDPYSAVDLLAQLKYIKEEDKNRYPEESFVLVRDVLSDLAQKKINVIDKM